MKGFGRPWKVNGRPWKATEGHGRLWKAVGGDGWFELPEHLVHGLEA